MLIALSVKADAGRHSPSYALSHYDTSFSGWGGFTFFIGLLPATYCFSAVGMISSMVRVCNKGLVNKANTEASRRKNAQTLRSKCPTLSHSASRSASLLACSSSYRFVSPVSILPSPSFDHLADEKAAQSRRSPISSKPLALKHCHTFSIESWEALTAQSA